MHKTAEKIPLGEGLFKQILDREKRAYDTEKAMASLIHEMKVHKLMNELSELVNKNKVTQEELISIQELIKSPDYENLTVAESIIKEYGK